MKWEKTVLTHSLFLRFLESESLFWTEVDVRACLWVFIHCASEKLAQKSETDAETSLRASLETTFSSYFIKELTWNTHGKRMFLQIQGRWRVFHLMGGPRIVALFQ